MNVNKDGGRALRRAVHELPLTTFGTAKKPTLRLRKSTLVAIAEFADADGSNSFPAIARLAEYVNVTDRSIHRVLDELEKLGLLEIQSKQGRICAHGKTNRYRVLVMPSPSKCQVNAEAKPSKCQINLGSTPELCEPKPELCEPKPDALKSQITIHKPSLIPIERETNLFLKLWRTGNKVLDDGLSVSVFTKNERKPIVALLEQYTDDEFVGAYRAHLAGKDAFELKHVNRNFPEVLAVLVQAYREDKAESAEEVQKMDEARVRLEEQAAKEREATLAAADQEEELVEDTLGE
ncbi:MAG: helix-turn-helix domain-containing protein [Acidobacteria bacterium]|nr:helix-turn-helix domain-containing protein [Acidobacteriota bacterium]